MCHSKQTQQFRQQKFLWCCSSCVEHLAITPQTEQELLTFQEITERPRLRCWPSRPWRIVTIADFHVLRYSLEWWGTGVVVCLERGADLHMAQLMPLPLTVSCSSKILIGSTFLVPAYPGCPGKEAVKWL